MGIFPVWRRRAARARALIHRVYFSIHTVTDRRHTRLTHGTTSIVIDTVLPAQYRRAARSAGAARERVSVCARVARRPADRRPGATAAVGGRCAPERRGRARVYIRHTILF